MFLKIQTSKLSETLLNPQEVSQVPDAHVFGLGGRDTGEVLGHVVAEAAAERVVVFTSRVLQVVVTLVVEHLV